MANDAYLQGDDAQPDPTPKVVRIQASFRNKDHRALERSLEMMNIELRYNLRSNCDEINENGQGWKRIDDRLEADLRARIKTKFKYQTFRGDVPLVYGKDTWQECKDALQYHREVDPFLLWLDELAQGDGWDMKPRLDTLLHDLFKCEQDEFSRWASRYPFIGAIQRAMKPGCRLREIPVLIGPQTMGKSAFCRAIFPDESDWFVEGLSLTDSRKSLAEGLQGAVLVELDELSGISRADIEHVKSFISRTDDGAVRLSYRRNPEPLPRRCVIVGTSNKEQCLPNDPTGNSRFVPVKCKRGANVERFMSKNRDQLWLEAYAEYAAGERANLPRELMPQQAELNEGFRDGDLLTEDFIDSLPDQPMTLTEIMKFQSCPREIGSRRLATALQQVGWKSKQVRDEGTNRNVRKWHPPEGWQPIKVHKDEPF